MRTVAIIPARGGSKGIPGKNLQPIGGVPLVAWPIRAALGARSIAAVYVSTDSKKIAAVARQYGANVIMRPAELARDETPTLPVVQHVVDQLAERPEVVVILQCTSPLTTSEDIDQAVAELRDDPALVSVEEDHGYLVTRDGSPINHSPDDRRRRRQDRQPQFRLNGAMFVLRTPVPDEWPDRCGVYVMPSERSIDIDDTVDLHLAESLLRYDRTWIVCGAGPWAHDGLAEVRTRYPHAKTITTNQGIQLFPTPDRPDVYLLIDMLACRLYHDAAMAAQSRGTRLVTLRRPERALKDRGLELFDEFLPGGTQGEFVRGGYTASLSGLLCLQYAINHGARRIHLVGMPGYTGTQGGDYFGGYEPGEEADANPDNIERRRRHTLDLIQPFTQAVVDGCPDIEFVFHGRLNYTVAGPNVRRIVPREELTGCE